MKRAEAKTLCNAGKDVTKKFLKKKDKSGNWKHKTVPAKSVFSFFSPPQIPEGTSARHAEDLEEVCFPLSCELFLGKMTRVCQLFTGNVVKGYQAFKASPHLSVYITNLDIAKFAIKRRVSAWFTANP
jgi:hypothetical protein